MIWVKSSYSLGSGECVEVAKDGDSIHVRDSKDPDGPTLTFTHDEWDAFLSGVALGDFDFPR